MDSVVLQMLVKYKCKTSVDYENALKEIMQEIALLGLWRAKFFERFQCLDIDQARQDVRIFLNERERQSLEVWGNEFFIKSISRINLSGY